ncbi:hypothetical protein [Mycetocola sp. JXN-3]|uniref:hypothetical protein n=1 Tax=Mycetocola sp. JXN-3 TaxID=2116510 RepID=UPI00165D2C1B|nr:hypothetical protein [Mycetocola sp. JXN-3]
MSTDPQQPAPGTEPETTSAPKPAAVPDSAAESTSASVPESATAFAPAAAKEPLHRRLFRTRSARVWTVAVLAALTGVALLGGPGTIAYLSDQASGPTATISAASGISATATATLDTVTTGTSRTIVAAPGTGIVPGVRAQRIRFVVTAAATNPVQTKISGTITATATDLGVTMYGRGALKIGAEGSAGCTVSGAQLSAGKITATLTQAPNTTLKPGASCTIDVTVAVPATADDGGDVARELRELKSSPLAAFKLDATLTQVPRSEERP